MKSKFKRFEKHIKLYESFIEKNKIPTSLIPYYKKLIKVNKRIIRLLENDKMTPKIFSKFKDNLKWEICNYIKNVIWCCKHCKAEITRKIPDRASPFSGRSIHCSNCGSELTYRTGGGMNDPFNYTFKKIRRK